MYYKIAEVILFSPIHLISFDAFACEAQKTDVILTVTHEKLAKEVQENRVGQMVCGRVEGGWFFHPVGDERKGLIASEDYSQLSLLRKNLEPADYEEEWYIRIALECLLIHRGYVSLHAASIELEGKAIAFSAPPGTGKSTRAQAWEVAFGGHLINGDRPLVRVVEPEVFGVPWDGKEQCFRNVHYPLSYICEVRRSKTNNARKMSFRQKRQLLLKQCFIPMWDTETAVVQMMNIAKLASAAEIIRVFGGPECTDAVVLREIIESGQIKNEESDMKAKSGFVLRHLVGEYVLMPVGDNISKYHGMILLNEVSAFIWKKLQEPVSRDDLLRDILDEYEVKEAKAKADLDAFLLKLKEYDILEEMR